MVISCSFARHWAPFSLKRVSNEDGNSYLGDDHPCILREGNGIDLSFRISVICPNLSFLRAGDKISERNLYGKKSRWVPTLLLVTYSGMNKDLYEAFGCFAGKGVWSKSVK